MRYLTILLILAAAGPAGSEPMSRLFVVADAAVADIRPLRDDRRFVHLPSLVFALAVEPRCASNMRAESISISIADTRETYGPVDFADHPTFEVSLTIPRQQISPLNVAGFCRADHDEDDSPPVLNIRDVFTAQLSLRCANDVAKSIVYASRPLDVSLRCRRTAAAPENEAAGNQEASPASSPR